MTDRGGSLLEEKPEGIARFVPGLTDDEAARVVEEMRDCRWVGAHFGESRRRFRDSALPAQPLARNMMLNVSVLSSPPLPLDQHEICTKKMRCATQKVDATFGDAVDSAVTIRVHGPPRVNT